MNSKFYERNYNAFKGADERRFTKKQGPAYLGAQSSQRQSRVKKITTDNDPPEIYEEL